MSVKRVYYPINEQSAYYARQMWSMTEYKTGSNTKEYRSMVDEVYNLVDRIETEKPDYLEQAERIAERYSRKLASWFNEDSSIEMMCPSVMISGGSNFPVRKKEKQNARRDSHMKDYNDYIQHIPDKLTHILNGSVIIKSNDENVIERLQEKLEGLEVLQEGMKNANAYYKKNGNLDEFRELPEDAIKKAIESMQYHSWDNKPFPSFELTNNNAKIKNTKERLERLQKAKENGTKEVENEFCKVIENTELMRIQLIFDGKPDDKIREILKSNGFKWCPSNMAWQRQLTNNGKYATKQVLKELEGCR
jgi:hypothetical protein